MRRLLFNLYLPLFILLLFVLAFKSLPTKSVVYTTITPLVGIGRALMPTVDFRSIVPPGVDPHHFIITPSKLNRLADIEQIIALTGKFPMEKHILIPIINYKHGIKVIFVAKAIKLIDNDPHVWLSVRNLSKIIAEFARSFDIAVDERLLERLRRLDQRFQSLFSELKVRSFLCLHPAWKYFARDYGLNMVSVMDYSGNVSPLRLKRIIDKCRAGNFAFIFVEKGFNARLIAPLISSCKIFVIKVNPLAEDIVSEFENIATQLERLKQLRENP